MKQVKNPLFIAIFAIIFAAPSYASNHVDTFIEDPIELKWIGNVENKSIFVLDFSEQNKTDTYKLIITDGSGYEFFNEVIDPSKKTRKFFLNADELADTKVNFELTSKTTGKKISYQVTMQQTTTNEMKLTRL